MTNNEDRLREALRQGAHVRPTTDDDVSAFRHRLADSTATTRTPSRRRTQWRTPLVAAAAVVAVAVTVSAIATGGFRMRQSDSASPNPAGGTSGGSDEMGGTRVPIIPASAGIVIAPASGGSAKQAPPDTQTSRSPSAVSDDSAGHMLIRVGSSATSNAITMDGMLVYPDGSTILVERLRSDGTPLGLVGVLGRTSAHDAYIWGAVSTDVRQLQILASPGGGSGSAATATRYVVASGRSDPMDLGPPTGTATWTDLGGGRHGFALQLPDSAQHVDLYAFTAGMRNVQGLGITVQSGATSDLPLLATPGAVVTTVAPGDIDWASLTAAMPPPGTDPNDAADACMKATGIRPDLAVAAPGLGTTVCFDLSTDQSELRVFDGTDWHGVLPVNGPRDQLLRFFGSSGLLVDSFKVHPTPGRGGSVAGLRLVYGIVGPDARHIKATDGIRQIGTLHAIPGTDLRAFVMVAGPHAGSVTVSDDADHQVTGSVNAATAASTSATPSP